MFAGTPVPPGGLDSRRIETELRARLERVREQIAALARPPDQSTGVQFGKRVGDGTTEAISRFVDVGVANDLSAVERRLDRALEKLADGSYGVCDECGTSIGRGRLGVAPESVLCLQCARQSR
jgi:DnaK suppressor protein